MTPVATALFRVLDDLDGLGLSACEQTGVAYALLAQALACRADRDWALGNIELNLRADIAKIEALGTPYPKAANSHNGKGGSGGHTRLCRLGSVGGA
jgi:hypothetical protein